MNVAQLLEMLKSEAARRSVDDSEAVWYLFGSAKSQGERSLDVDVLIVAANDERCQRIRHSLDRLLLLLPVHLLIMSRSEEEELDFVSGQKCIQFYPVAGEAY
jgi:predicted nucleotidyltransferase